MRIEKNEIAAKLLVDELEGSDMVWLDLRSGVVPGGEKDHSSRSVVRMVSQTFTARTNCASGRVNCYQAKNPAATFGGNKMCGYGQESGMGHVAEYLNTKAVWIKTA